jgi:hypothetical protein
MRLDSSLLRLFWLFRISGEFFGVPGSVQRVLEGLFAQFVSGEMISFAVGDSGGSVGMGCQVVQFRGSIVRTLGHCVLLACSMHARLGKDHVWRSRLHIWQR